MNSETVSREVEGVTFNDYLWFLASLATSLYFMWSVLSLSFNPQDYTYISLMFLVGLLPLFASTGIFAKFILKLMARGRVEYKTAGKVAVLWFTLVPAATFLIAGATSGSFHVAVLVTILVISKVRETINHSITALMSSYLAIIPAFMLAFLLDNFQFVLFSGREAQIVEFTQVVSENFSFSAQDGTVLVFGLLSSSFIFCDTIIDFIIMIIRKKIRKVVSKDILVQTVNDTSTLKGYTPNRLDL